MYKKDSKPTSRRSKIINNQHSTLHCVLLDGRKIVAKSPRFQKLNNLELKKSTRPHTTESVGSWDDTKVF